MGCGVVREVTRPRHVRIGVLGRVYRDRVAEVEEVIDNQEGGSGAGKQAICKGLLDLGASSSAVAASGSPGQDLATCPDVNGDGVRDAGKDLVETVVGYDAVVLAYAPGRSGVALGERESFAEVLRLLERRQERGVKLLLDPARLAVLARHLAVRLAKLRSCSAGTCRLRPHLRLELRHRTGEVDGNRCARAPLRALVAGGDARVLVQAPGVGFPRPVGPMR